MKNPIRYWQKNYFTIDVLSQLFKFKESLKSVSTKNLKLDYGFEEGDLVTCDNASLLVGKRFYLCGLNINNELLVLAENCRVKFNFNPNVHFFRLWTPKDEFNLIYRKCFNYFQSLFAGLRLLKK